ncbi:MAG: aromatic ring-hydroxylating dioxygenase subunit alpha [Rhodobacter sp.]|nr:aromatic ring-hydroxylating dioxygenase subunit alpha [Rhodobacter sp.]
MSRVADLRAQLQATASLPADRPQGLSGAFYTDPDYFDWECRSVLRSGWYCLGRTDEIPEPGDYFTARILNEPLIVVRGDDCRIRVLSNVCRHRGMPLAEGSGNTRRFVCPYHAWAYGRDGALLRAARMDNAGFDAKSCRLPGFASTHWRGFVYCNLNPEAAPFIDAAPDLDTLVAPYQGETFRVVHSAEEAWRTNWKCLVENFMEGYHLSVVHPVTLHGYTPTGLAKKAASGPGFTSYNANYPLDIPPRGTGAPGLSDAERKRSTLFAVFPAQVASQASSLLVSLSIFPLAVDLIRVKWTMSVFGDDLDEATVSARIALWEQVNAEDRDKLEKLQQALGSDHARAGPLAGDDYEGTIRDFHLWLATLDRAAGGSG